MAGRLRKIAILLHEMDRRGLDFPYIVWLLRVEWEKEGLQVEVIRGIDRQVDADILFPQIDLSVMPDEYLRFSRAIRTS